MNWLKGRYIYMRMAEEKNIWTSSLVVSISAVTTVSAHNMLHRVTRDVAVPGQVLRPVHDRRWLK